MFSNLIISLFLGLIFGVGLIFFDSAIHEHEYKNEVYGSKRLKKIFWITYIISVLTIFSVWNINFYGDEIPKIAQLQTDYEYSLGNVLTLANNLNEKVIVKTDNDKLIIDVANMSQSTLTSEVYLNYVKGVNQYNISVTEYKTKGKRNFFNIIYYGFYPPIPDFKFIKIKL